MGKKHRKKRYRGHYCWCCGCIKPSEKFSGRGHRDHICKACQKLPREKRQKIDDEHFVFGIFRQKNISSGNIKRLENIAESYAGETLGRQGAALAKVGRIKPGRKKRMGKLYHDRKELFDELLALDLIWDSITPQLEEERYWEENCSLEYLGDLSCFESDAELHELFELISAYERAHYGEVIIL